MVFQDQNMNNYYGGNVYTGQPNQYATKQPSTLTSEEYNRLVKQENPFSLALTELERLRAICNHRTIDGMGDTLTQMANGQMKCTVCGYEFLPIDAAEMTKEDIVASVKVVTDILQTIKLMFVDMPAESQREYFQIIPLIERIPGLFDLAVKNYQKYESMNVWNYRGANLGTMNLFNMLSSALTGMGPQQQPTPQYGNPAFGVFGTGMNPNMGMGTPMSPYAPQTTGYNLTPGMTPDNSGTPAGTTATTDGATVNATATFKA